MPRRKVVLGILIPSSGSRHLSHCSSHSTEMRSTDMRKQQISLSKALYKNCYLNQVGVCFLRVLAPAYQRLFMIRIFRTSSNYQIEGCSLVQSPLFGPQMFCLGTSQLGHSSFIIGTLITGTFTIGTLIIGTFVTGT